MTIEQDYIFQTGDPTNTGRGGESVFSVLYGDQARYFDMELVPKIRHSKKGLISFVNNGSNEIGSQFFITLADELDYLDGKHCVFGEVSEGFETLSNINITLCDDKHKPFRDIRIAHTIILDDPFGDPPNLPVPSRSPSPSLELVTLTDKIALDEKVNEDEGKTAEEIKKELEQKEMHAQAQILEMIGDLRYADEKPPDNVLFVCKLNPVTTSEDLEIIFGRYGEIVECEVIKDRRTQQSLQYAFIEFETPKQCEAAYFKMDNVLIDDRRIHVDFSQSVAKKFTWKKKKDETFLPPRKVAKKERKRSPSTNFAAKHRQDRNRREGSSEERRNHCQHRSRSPGRRQKRKRSPERQRKHKDNRRRLSPERRRYKSPESERRYKKFSESERRSQKSPDRKRHRNSSEDDRHRQRDNDRGSDSRHKSRNDRRDKK